MKPKEKKKKTIKIKSTEKRGRKDLQSLKQVAHDVFGYCLTVSGDGSWQIGSGVYCPLLAGREGLPGR